MTTFTPAETKLLAACMRCMVSDVNQCKQAKLTTTRIRAIQIDFHKVALEAGYKDAKNAKVMFARLKKNKLDGATTGAGLPKPTTPTKKGTGGTTTAARKGGIPNSGVVKATGGAGVKGGKARKGRKAVTDGADVDWDAEVRADDEGVAGVKAASGSDGSGDGDGSEVEVDGSGEEVVKEEHYDEGADGQVVNGFTAINHAGVEEANELGDEEEA